MLPSENETQPLDDVAMRQIAQRFQARAADVPIRELLNSEEFRLPSCALQDFTPRMKQVTLVLVAPIQGHRENESIVLSKLRERDRDAQTERSLEPEWLVAEILFGLVHERRIHSVLVGGIASSINEKLKSVARVFELAPRRLA
jgi:hypothetical protein